MLQGVANEHIMSSSQLSSYRTYDEYQFDQDEMLLDELAAAALMGRRRGATASASTSASSSSTMSSDGGSYYTTSLSSAQQHSGLTSVTTETWRNTTYDLHLRRLRNLHNNYRHHRPPHQDRRRSRDHGDDDDDDDSTTLTIMSSALPNTSTATDNSSSLLPADESMETDFVSNTGNHKRPEPGSQAQAAFLASVPLAQAHTTIEPLLPSPAANISARVSEAAVAAACNVPATTALREPLRATMDPPSSPHFSPVLPLTPLPVPERPVVSPTTSPQLPAYYRHRTVVEHHQHDDDTGSLSSKVSIYQPPLDLTVVLSDHTCRHSSQILAYASPVLSSHLRPTQGGQYVLTLPQATQHEWQLLVPFLEPHTRQVASINARNLPVLLPWLQELELTVLLRECDALLSSCLQLDRRRRCFPGGHHGHADAPDDHPDDVHDVVRLTQICQHCGHDTLPRTWQQCHVALERLLRPQHARRWQLADLQTLSTLVGVGNDSHDGGGPNDPTTTNLWRCLIQYLPPDLSVFTHQDELVRNPLFAYLLRQGMQQKALENETEGLPDVSTDDDNNDVDQHGRHRSSHDRGRRQYREARDESWDRGAEHHRRNTTSRALTPPTLPSAATAPSESSSSSKYCATPSFMATTPSAQAIAAELEAAAKAEREPPYYLRAANSFEQGLDMLSDTFDVWWHAWQDGEGPRQCNNARQQQCHNWDNNDEHDENSGLNRGSPFPYGFVPPSSRSAWLETIWHRLQQPRLFPDDSDDDIATHRSIMMRSSSSAHILEDHYHAEPVPQTPGMDVAGSGGGGSAVFCGALGNSSSSSHGSVVRGGRRTFAC